MRGWPYIDGQHLSQGIDLLELFQTMDSGRCFNIIDNIIVEEALKDRAAEGELVKMRARLNKEYNNSREADYNESPEYEAPTDEGYSGLAPAG